MALPRFETQTDHVPLKAALDFKVPVFPEHRKMLLFRKRSREPIQQVMIRQELSAQSRHQDQLAALVLRHVNLLTLPQY